MSAVEVDHVTPAHLTFLAGHADRLLGDVGAYLALRRPVHPGGSLLEPDVRRIEAARVEVAELRQLQRLDALDDRSLPRPEDALGPLDLLARLEGDGVVRQVL